MCTAFRARLQGSLNKRIKIRTKIGQAAALIRDERFCGCKVVLPACAHFFQRAAGGDEQIFQLPPIFALPSGFVAKPRFEGFESKFKKRRAAGVGWRRGVRRKVLLLFL